MSTCVQEALHCVYCKRSHAAFATPENEKLCVLRSLFRRQVDDDSGPISATNAISIVKVLVASRVEFFREFEKINMFALSEKLIGL